MPFSDTWNGTFEAIPDDSEVASQGASRIRDLKTAISERMEIDHSWAGDANDGKHLKITLPVHTGNPANIAGTGIVYTKTVGGGVELFYENAAGTVLQLTSGGTFNLSAVAAFPVGSIYISATDDDPATTLGYGTWVAFGAAKTLVGVGTDFAIGATGGEVEHTLTTNEIPAHTHSIPARTDEHSSVGGATPLARSDGNVTWNSGSTGGGAAHNNMPPYVVVYFWKRTA